MSLILCDIMNYKILAMNRPHTVGIIQFHKNTNLLLYKKLSISYRKCHNMSLILLLYLIPYNTKNYASYIVDHYRILS
jgi:hypothetical protein